jgi:predicted permease
VTDDDRLEAEIEFHVDMQTEKNIRQGMSVPEARRDALVRFGGRTRWKESVRDEYRFAWIADAVRDLRLAARRLRRTPGFAAIAILTIVLGIAASATVFSFVDGVFMRRLDAAHADRLVRIFVARTKGEDGAFGMGAYRLLRDRAKSFDTVAAHYSTAPLYVAANGESSEVAGAVVSASYFAALGATPLLGRVFRADEDAIPDRDAVAVIGYGFWRSRFGGAAAVIGGTLTINGRPFQIVGVMPEGFLGVVPSQSVNEIWIPTAMFRVGYRWCDALSSDPGCTMAQIFARLAPSADIAQAQSEVATLAADLHALSDPDQRQFPVVVEAARGLDRTQQRGYAALARLLGASALVFLLITCANLGGLLLAREIASQRDIALRLSLGAGRGRIVRQLMTEQLLLAAIGGPLGIVLSVGTTGALSNFFALDSEGYVHVYDFGVNARSVAVALLLSAGTAIVSGLAPAWWTSRVDPADGLKSAGDGGRTGGSGVRALLVSLQLALSLVLLVAAGLLTRSFDRVMAQRILDPSHVALLRLRPRLVGYAPDRAQTFLRNASAALAELPEVQSVAIARGVGFIWRANGSAPVGERTDADGKDDTRLRIEYGDVAPNFFATLGVRILRGRDFAETDRPNTPKVAIVTESLAARLWPGQSPLDRMLVLGGKRFLVVGLVPDYRLPAVGEPPPPMAFVAFWQSSFEPQIDARLAIRVKGDPRVAMPTLRRAIARVDAAVPITETLAMDDQIGGSYRDVRLSGAMLRWSALLAVFLSGIGLYGVVAFLVGRRTREVGIRLAIGAPPGRVVAGFVRQTLTTITAGLVVGLLAAAGGARLLSTWLFGVQPLDGVTFLTALAGMTLVALIAAYLPARRAARVDPAVALRAE